MNNEIEQLKIELRNLIQADLSCFQMYLKIEDYSCTRPCFQLWIEVKRELQDDLPKYVNVL